MLLFVQVNVDFEILWIFLEAFHTNLKNAETVKDTLCLPPV
jgi:hypothetical protein